MKFLSKMPQRILGIELQRKLLLSGKSHGELGQRSTLNAQRPTLNSNAARNLKPSSIQLSTNCLWLLHEFDGCAIWIANVYDSFTGIRTRLKSLRFTGSFPTGRVDRAQNRGQIIDDKGNMHRTAVAWPKIDMPFTVGRCKIFEQLDLVTTRCFHDCELDLRTCDTCDLSGHFASLMCRM